MTFVNVNSRNQSPPLLDFDLLHQSSRGPGPMKGLYYSICICTSNPKMPILSDHYLKLVEVHTQLPPLDQGMEVFDFPWESMGAPTKMGPLKIRCLCCKASYCQDLDLKNASHHQSSSSDLPVHHATQ